jgi:hypothetical protein
MQFARQQLKKGDSSSSQWLSFPREAALSRKRYSIYGKQTEAARYSGQKIITMGGRIQENPYYARTLEIAAPEVCNLVKQLRGTL